MIKLTITESKSDTYYYAQMSVRNGKTVSSETVERIGKHSELLKITNDPEAYANAMTTAASITAPILIASDTVSPVLGAIACCVGSLFFGYFNDSYFWVVNRTLGVSDGGDQLRVWSATSTIAWAVGVVEVLILSIFIH